MKTLTAEQFKKNYGEAGLSSFNESQRVEPSNRSIVKETFSAVTSLPSNIMDSFEAGIQKSGTGLEQIFSNPATGKDSSFSELGRGVLNLGSGLLETAFSPVTGTIKSVADVPGISDTLGLVKNKVIDPSADAISNIKSLQEFAVNNPNAEEVFSNGLNIITALYAPKALPKGKTSTQTVSVAAEAPKPTQIPTQEVSAGIMNRVARLKPTDATQFEKISGKTHGQYLTETGNFGSPEKIISNEAQKFTQSMKAVDNELDNLPGVYKDGSIQDALNQLVDKARSVSTENVPSPYLSQVEQLMSKYKSGGLTMREINEVKRLFERNVKLGYNKLLNPEKVETATNIDNSLRKWQLQKAKDLGFKNIDSLNKQTQISKFLVNKLGDQLIGQSGLNSLNLTDWVMLSGGNPTAVSGFLTKKFFSSRAVQAKIAEILNSGEPVKGQILPEVSPTVENTLRGQFPSGTMLELPPGGSSVVENRVPIQARGASSIEPPAQKIFNESMNTARPKVAPQSKKANKRN